jgi:hypothetical protein
MEKSGESVNMRENGLPQNRGDFSAMWSTSNPFLSGVSSRRAVARSRWSGFEETRKRPPKSLEFPAVTLDNFADDHLAPTVIKIDLQNAEDGTQCEAETVIRRSTQTSICKIHHPGPSEATEQARMWNWLNDKRFSRHLLGTARVLRPLDVPRL